MQASSFNDQRVEEIVGNVLRFGVLIAAAVVLLGAMLFLFHNGHTKPNYGLFRGEPGDLRDVPGVVHDALALRGRGMIQFGLLLLIATPIARVAFSAIAFALQRDRLYVFVTLLVLAILVLSLSGRAP